MKNFHSHFFLLLALLFSTIQTIQAQNFAYVNSQLILSEMSEVKQANDNLEELQKSLQKELEASTEKLKADYYAVQQKVERGLLSPAEQEQESAKLQKLQKKLADDEQGMVAQIEAKREFLFGPIYDRVNNAIMAVAQENGYKMIFDQAVLLYSSDALDVSKQVRAKLGL